MEFCSTVTACMPSSILKPGSMTSSNEPFGKTKMTSNHSVTLQGEFAMLGVYWSLEYPILCWFAELLELELLELEEEDE